MWFYIRSGIVSVLAHWIGVQRLEFRRQIPNPSPREDLLKLAQQFIFLLCGLDLSQQQIEQMWTDCTAIRTVGSWNAGLIVSLSLIQPHCIVPNAFDAVGRRLDTESEKIFMHEPYQPGSASTELSPAVRASLAKFYSRQSRDWSVLSHLTLDMRQAAFSLGQFAPSTFRSSVA